MREREPIAALIGAPTQPAGTITNGGGLPVAQCEFGTAELSAFGAMAARTRRRKDSVTASVKSADRVLDLFELLARWGEEMPHAEIAGTLRIPKSSLTQLLRTLIARGYIDYAPASKGYRLGNAFAQLSQRRNDVRRLVELVEPVLRQIHRATDETCALNQLKGDMVEVVATVSGSQRLAAHTHPGDLAPLYATSCGKALLAHLPSATQRDYVANVRFETITPKTIRSRSMLRRQLAAVRRERVAFSFDEFTPGIVGVSVPVLSGAGFALGSLNVAMPSVRYSPASRDAVIRALRAGAERVERQIRRTEQFVPQGVRSG